MQKFFPKLTVKSLCTLGLLMAITALLSIFCTFRIGSVIKIPIKFISVFVTAAIFGPIFGGITGAVGDLLNCILAPSGPIIPQITAIEFLSGFVYGLFFFKPNLTKKTFLIRVVLCVFVQFFIDMFITTALFVQLTWYPTFWSAFAARIIAGVIKPVLQIAMLLMSRKYLNQFRQLALKH